VAIEASSTPGSLRSSEIAAELVRQGKEGRKEESSG
jgi:hypothetical protein